MLEYLPIRDAREITIDGYAVPGIEACETPDGLSCNIFLDQRFGATIPAEHASSVLWLLANALAIGAGYSCHGENSIPFNRYKTRVAEIEGASRSGDREPGY